MTKFLCIACEVIARPIYLSAAHSSYIIDIELIDRGLHNQPRDLKACIQSHIDHAEGRGYNAILLGYGLCGNGTEGLEARSVQLVLPRVHDCISLLLGDPKRYQDQFDQHPGTFWYSQDFLERSDNDNKYAAMGFVSDEELSKQYDSNVVKYGKENADYLMEVMSGWQSHYQRAVFIDLGIIDLADSQKQVQLDAKQRGWTYEAMVGDLLLFRQLLNGDWSSSNLSNFIVIPPNHSSALSYDSKIFSCED